MYVLKQRVTVQYEAFYSLHYRGDKYDFFFVVSLQQLYTHSSQIVQFRCGRIN